jgi:hypothetical protein
MNLSLRSLCSNAVVFGTALLVSVPTLLAQADTDTGDTLPEFNLMRTPASPAFTLLDLAPTAVERPGTPAAVAISLLSATTGLTQLPSDYSLELSPYWLFGHPQLTWQSDTTRNIWESIQRTATLSFGTAKAGDSANATMFSSGLRLSLFSGQMSAESLEYLDSAQNALTRNAAAFYEATAVARRDADSIFIAQLRANANNPAAQEIARQQHEAAIQKINATAIEQFEEEELQNFALQREGFLLELALGGVWHFADAAADSGRLSRFGVWVTPAYQWTNWSVVGVGRLFMNKVGDTTQATFDAGARLIFTQDKYGVSLEAVSRSYTWDNAPKPEWRIAAVVDVEITEDTWLTSTFGKDYRGSASGSLLAKLGISLNLSSKRYVME